MRYVRLGKTELEVSAIAFGTWAFGGDWGSFDAHESKAAIHHALDLGVTFFDTAQAYGFGVSERLLADALWERWRRDEVIVATIGVLIYGPLAHGLLSGRMTLETKFPADDWRSHSSDFTGKSLRQNLHVIDRLTKYAAGRGLTLPQLAVAWTTSHPAVHVAIVGARRASQLDGTVPAADLSLSQQDRGEIARILSEAVPVTGPSPEGM